MRLGKLRSSGLYDAATAGQRPIIHLGHPGVAMPPAHLASLEVEDTEN